MSMSAWALCGVADQPPCLTLQFGCTDPMAVWSTICSDSGSQDTLSKKMPSARAGIRNFLLDGENFLHPAKTQTCILVFAPSRRAFFHQEYLTTLHSHK